MVKCLLQSMKQIHRFFSSCLHRASIVLKHFFIIPTDAHNYKMIGMLKTIKIPTIAPTCFGSRGNHHQGAISCLAKTTIMILLCSSLMMWSMLWRHTSLLCKCAVQSTGNSFLLCKHAVHGRGSSFLYRVLHACTTGWYADITLITSLISSTIES